MRTTLNLDDTLLMEAKALAARERLSLTRLIEQGLALRLRLAAAPYAVHAPPISLPVRSDHPHHPVANRWLEESLAACALGQRLAVLPMVATGFQRLVTHPRVFVEPTPGCPHTTQISSKSNPRPSASSLPSTRLALSSRSAIPCWPPRQISTARSWGNSNQPRRAPLAW